MQREIAFQLVANGRGILAADESTATIAKRLASVSAANTEETRRSYRELLFTTVGLERWISGVILFDETLRQSTAGGERFADLLRGRGVLPGIKVDRGTQPLPGSPGETITEGLDGLGPRLAEYRGLGATFTKWRAVLHVGDGRPGARAVHANAEALGRYAALAQEAGLVPIVEPEVLMEGGHDLAACEAATERTLEQVFRALAFYGVELESLLLKPNMVVPGKEGPTASTAEVAGATLRCLRRTVPSAVPGIAFLSGGQSARDATERLDAMNRLGPHPWPLTYSYGRALQDEALRTWSGRSERVAAAQAALARRASLTSLAAQGRYEPAMEAA